MLKRFGLNRLFGNTADPSAETTPQEIPPGGMTRRQPPAGTRILVVDDSKTTQAIITRTLEQQGYACSSAYDAEDGLLQARREQPALILMDVILPGINGFQATRSIRRDEQLADIPVIIMSGNKEATEQFWSLKIGANAFLHKPFSDDDLLGNIERCLFAEFDNMAQLAGELIG